MTNSNGKPSADQSINDQSSNDQPSNDQSSEATPPADSPETPDSIKQADRANGEGDPGE